MVIISTIIISLTPLPSISVVGASHRRLTIRMPWSCIADREKCNQLLLLNFFIIIILPLDRLFVWISYFPLLLKSNTLLGFILNVYSFRFYLQPQWHLNLQLTSSSSLFSSCLFSSVFWVKATEESASGLRSIHHANYATKCSPVIQRITLIVFKF